MSKKNRSSSPDGGDSSVSNETSTNSASSGTGAEKKDRRAFMKLGVAGGIGLCAVGAPICAGARAAISPVFQVSESGKFYPLIAEAELTEKPLKMPIIDAKKDAWTVIPDQKIGSVFLRKSKDGKIIAIHSLCPHAGCAVQAGPIKNPKTNEEEELFYCPCHAAHFDLDGVRLDGVSPRDLDTLETKIENGTVFVKFENFAFGTPEKRA